MSIDGGVIHPHLATIFFFGDFMKPTLPTLKDIKIYQEIRWVLEPHLPEDFIDAVFNHMQGNQEDLFDHEYLRNSLLTAKRIVDGTVDLSEGDQKLLYAIVALFEIGRPLSKLYPYDLSAGVGWMFLRLYAHDLFGKDDIRFITQSCKPLSPHTLRPSHRARLLLIVHNTKRLTDVVSLSYVKLYKEFVYNQGRIAGDETTNKLFLEYYGPGGNLWPAISVSAKKLFSKEIAKFQREVRSAVEITL